MLGDPASAPPRADLTFLRARRRPAAASRPQASAASRPQASAASSPPAAAAPGTAPTAAPGRIDYHRHRAPAPSGSLDLSAPAESPPAAASAPASVSPPASGSLDLSAPSAPPPARPRVDTSRPAAGGASLDLFADDPAPASAPAPVDVPVPASGPVRAPVPVPLPVVNTHVHRVRGREQRLMSVSAPTVTLTRPQSGIGDLTLEAVCSPEIGDLRLGAAYQLRSGGTGVVSHIGTRFAPSSRRPVLVAGREEYERIGVDLRQIADIERIAVFAFSESRRELTWGGTLVTHLFGGGRLELPLETLYAGRIAMLTTLYNLEGELVVRAELETIAGDVREAVRAYGFDRITWRDDRNPID